MWDNKQSGHTKVLLQIYWGGYKNWHYFLNAGSYDHEEEVLLYDGCSVYVKSVEEIKDLKGNHLYTKISLSK